MSEFGSTGNRDLFFNGVWWPGRDNICIFMFNTPHFPVVIEAIGTTAKCLIILEGAVETQLEWRWDSIVFVYYKEA